MIIVSFFIISRPAHAALTFAPESPQYREDTPVITITSDFEAVVSVHIFSPTGADYSYDLAYPDPVIWNVADYDEIGEYAVIECNSAAYMNDCGAVTLAEVLAGAGVVTQNYYTLETDVIPPALPIVAYIDYIYYNSTSTNQDTGEVILTESQYFIPFFDYILVLSVLCFNILVVLVGFYLLYPRKQKIKVVNKLTVKKRDLNFD